jgi:hypothetical protein
MQKHHMEGQNLDVVPEISLGILISLEWQIKGPRLRHSWYDVINVE